MQILLTDLATCPRCGPEWGLILLADQIEDRRVVAGRLGCANCREEYPIRAGVADLRLTEGSEGRITTLAGEDAALRLAALLGVAHGGGWLLLIGADAALGDAVAGLLPDIHVATVALVGTRAGGARSSTLVADAGVPFRDAVFRGVALIGGAGGGLLAEAARVVSPGGRVVVEQATGNPVRDAETAGLHVLLADGGTVVAERSGVARGTRHP